MRRLSKGFEIIEEAWSEAHRPKPSRTLKVTAPVAVVQRWLLVELAPQLQSETEIQIAWDVSHNYRALDGVFADVAIRNTATPDANLFSEPVLRQWFTPLARPDVARKIKTPADLFNHGLINVDFGLDGKPDSTAWQPWFVSQGLKEPERYEMFCANTVTAVDMAIETGHVAIGGYFVAANHIKSGRLVSPFDFAVCPQRRLWFMCPKGREEEPEIAWFRQAVRECATRLEATAAHLKMYDMRGEQMTENAR